MQIMAGNTIVLLNSTRPSPHRNDGLSNRKKTTLHQRIALAKKRLDNALLIHMCQAGIDSTIVLN